MFKLYFNVKFPLLRLLQFILRLNRKTTLYLIFKSFVNFNRLKNYYLRQYYNVFVLRLGAQENVSKVPGVYFLDQDKWNIGKNS